MKYIKVEWPEIQDYMNNKGYPDEVGFDPIQNVWYIPEHWEPDNLELGGDIGDLEDAMG